MKPKTILLGFGTRPEAVKMCPLVMELRQHNTLRVVVCVTGQHREMLRQVLDTFGIIPDYDLDVMKEHQTLFDITQTILENTRYVLEKERPDCILVHGDTTTAFALALAGFYMQIPIGHVEAGLRTYRIDSPYPEEFNRQAIDSMASLMFAPTQGAK